MGYDKMVLLLYIVTLFIIVVALSQWEVSIVFLLVLIIVLFQKISTEEKIEEISRNRDKIINVVTERLDSFSNKTEALKQNLNRNMFVIENRILEIRHSHEDEIEKHYRELARKIFDVENKLNAVKKTLGAAFGSLDERVKRFEKEEEWTG
jgi:uncharacterized protein YlxW (UPF0749 family)